MSHLDGLRPSRDLAAFACDPAASRGRLFAEPDSPTRTAFQRDRDRIVHSAAFRRLAYKTQVFVYHEGDHFRSRLTHSIEVSQIARSLARSLRLDEDLAEAIALAHDLGHTPFGHAGERALHAAMEGHGGFDHNAQSLAVVTRLERRYAAFDGLNLAWETLEGLAKHNGPLDPDAAPGEIAAYDGRHGLDLATHAGAEAQCAAIADDIAYTTHDFDDGLRAGLFTLEEVAGAVPLAADLLDAVRARYGGLDAPRAAHEITRRLITLMVEDVLAETQRRIAAAMPRSPGDVRAAPRPMAAFSQGAGARIATLRDFLFRGMYRHGRVMRVMRAAETVVGELFAAFRDEPGRLPGEWRAALDTGQAGRERIVADYIAGMTDRYALAEHRRLFDATPDLR